VTFQAPLFLLALGLLPLAALAYVAAQRRRRAAADAFASPAVRASALPRTPGWRRHAPMGLYGLALAALAVALARPEATIAVPTEQASVVLATDHSGSMRATDVASNRLAAARAAAHAFLERVPDRVRVGGVAFDHRAAVLAAPDTDRAPLEQAIDDLRPSGGTATGEALAASLDLVRRGGEERPPAAVVLISDGASTHGRDPLPVAREAGRLGIPVYTVALGTPDGTLVGSDGVRRPVPPDPATLRAIADASGGRAFTAQHADGLAAVYERLGSRVATERQPREVTAGFAGGALALLAGGALLSLRWFRRLVDAYSALGWGRLTAAPCASPASGPPSPPPSAPAGPWSAPRCTGW
jgi:Ca-activated chloride channel family protein